MKKWIICFMLLSLKNIFSMDYQQARDQGFIGELDNGQIALIKGKDNADLVGIVKDINAKRMQKYQKIATELGITVEEVQKIAHEKIKKQKAKGRYFNEGGTWIKK